jgi:LPXTG-motif cell wall-anchored protein
MTREAAFSRQSSAGYHPPNPKAIQPFTNEALMSATLTLLAGIALIAVGITMVIRRRRRK